MLIVRMTFVISSYDSKVLTQYSRYQIMAIPNRSPGALQNSSNFHQSLSK